MSDRAVPDPQVFYTEQVPAHWNRALEAQEQLGEEGRAVCEGMKAVNATIRVDLLESDASYFLNIASGRMEAGEQASHPPFLTLRQGQAAYEQLASEATGASPMALLGVLSGLGDQMRLTQQRIDDLAEVKGTVRFIIQGDEGFELDTHFGSDPFPDEPTASIIFNGNTYRELRDGEIHPQQAFMDGRIDLDGDMEMAFQLALAAMAPD
jgi:hypothetical protein